MSGTQLMNARSGTGVAERMVHACWVAMLLAMLSASGHVKAADDKAGPQLDDIQFSSLSGNRVQVELVMTGPVNAPRSFTTDTPARIALDFPQTTSNLAKKTFAIGIGVVHSVAAVQGKDRTRVVVDLVKMVPYQTRVEGNHFFITVEGGDIAAVTAPAVAPAPEGGAAAAVPANRIEAIDFRRGTKGEGRILVNLSNSAIPVNIHQEGDKIVLDFAGTGVPKSLERRLDVVDFATPVTMIDTFAVGKDTRMVISATGNFEHLAYQAERQFTVEVKPVTKTAQEALKKDETGYTGEKLSLNFQDIEVRSALQIIADFTGLNMVVSDTVKGSISLRLKDVPWDQALDIILKTKSLGMRKMGNVLMVAPSAEISAREKDELEAQKKISELEPMHSELIQINYAKAGDIANFIRSKAATATPAAGSAGGAAPASTSLLSERGTVTVDDRTNSLLIQDTASRLTEIRKMVAQLDIPVRQVLIESRIVIANDDFERDLGARFGVTNVSKNGSSGVVSVTGNAAGNDTVINSAITNVNSSGQPFPVTMPGLDNRLNVNLPVVNATASPGSIGLAILGKNSLVDLELSALQAEGRGEVVSNPRVITANQKEATIEQGVEIPYQEASSSGATSVSFKKAVLSLKVTPQITPDDRVIMDLNVNKDSVGQIYAGVPSINTRAINTQVLVENGETVVLGGIYEQTRSKDVTKIPFLGDLPYVGALFRSTTQVDDKVELLIFVTPKILKETLGTH